MATPTNEETIRKVVSHFIKWVDHQNSSMADEGMPRENEDGTPNEEYIVIGGTTTADSLIGGLVDSFIELDPWAFEFACGIVNEDNYVDGTALYGNHAEI